MAIEVIEKIQPYKITLTGRTGVSPNIYYYFTLKNKVYRGSTKTEDPKEAKKVAIKIYHEIDSGKTKAKSPKFDAIVSKFINYKKNYVTNETIEGYEYRSQFLMEFFRGKDIEAIDKNAFYEYQEWRTNYHVNKKKSRKDKRTLTVGNASINLDLGLLVSILRFAKEELDLLGKFSSVRLID